MTSFTFIYALTWVALSIVTEGAYLPYPYYTYQHPSPVSVPAITSVSSNIYRTPDNLGAISTYHKSIDTPFSSVRKSDVRVSNDAVTPLATAFHVAAAPVHLPATPFHTVHVPSATPIHAVHVPTATPVHAVHVPAATPVHAVHSAPVAIAYSDTPTVAHLTFDGFGTHYAW